MSFLLWNCQGLGNLGTIKGLRDLIRENNPHLVFLAETKCSTSQIEVLKRRLNLFGFCVESRGKSGGLALFWNKSVDVQLQSFSHYHIDVSVRLSNSEEWWRFSGVYGEPDTSKRTVFWNLLSRLHRQSVRPWLVAGDFNEILEHSEKEGGPLRAEWQIRNFRNCLLSCELHDLGFQDHSALVLELQLVKCWEAMGGRKCFRFEAAWLQDSACEDIVTKNWSSPGSLGDKIASRTLGPRSLGTELNSLILQEETYWKQRCKALWLKEGDRNSSFFHGKASTRHHTNSIRRLRNSAGEWTVSEEEVRRCILDYFEMVFTSGRPSEDDIRRGTEHLPVIVTTEMAEDLQRPFTPAESKGRKHFMNLKLDISKAYDRVEWSFLRTVLESLSSLFRTTAERGAVPGVAVCRGAPKISHLLFADDIMVFCPATLVTVQNVRHLLDIYKMASGQEINLHKSSAAFSRNTPVVLQQQLATLLGIRLENKHEIYLGLPAVAFRSKWALFTALKDRIWRRIQGWHEKSLSQAGKAVLIQAVVQAIPSYDMSCFRLPKTLLQEFQALAANFFWHNGEKRKIHWLSWDRLCSSKLDGGLGFQNLEAFNLALLGNTLDLLKAGCRWRIGTGHDVDIWKDPWILCPTSFRVISPIPLHSRASLVSDLILAETREWDVDAVSNLFWPEDRDLILQIPLSQFCTPDLLVWHYSSNGLYSVRSAYYLALSLSSPAGVSAQPDWRRTWCVVWQSQIPNKTKVFLWRAIRSLLPTASNLRKRMPFDPVCCLFCGTEDESPIHSLLQCSFPRQVWALSGLRWSDIDALVPSVEEWFKSLTLKLSPPLFNLFAMICWTIWWSRNLKCAGKEFLTPLQVVDFARSYLLAFSSQGQDCASVKSGNIAHWIPPPAGFVKINFDGGGSAGVGCGGGDAGRTWIGFNVEWIGVVQRFWRLPEALYLAIRQWSFLEVTALHCFRSSPLRYRITHFQPNC
ncbi:UNVERIFIED_CONTAM: hypothetical protein Sradi_2074200 [Sesamum radiatum]|uniref:Reverse transcriptase zinc-binding domain-containing protein n=1 Tax=Sesamum radiatum TaxID=300843 RepID=A0AAW2TI70_SESRA